MAEGDFVSDALTHRHCRGGGGDAEIMTTMLGQQRVI